MKQFWPKKPFEWIEGGTLHVSVPFTWNLPELRDRLMQRSFLWSHAIVGGPAVSVMPDYLDGLDHVDLWNDCNGVLQKVNPLATRTTYGCPNSCGFCAVNLIEGEFRELDDWPDLPIIADSNLLAASQSHFDRVMDRLEGHSESDFCQGLDVRLLTEYHAERLTRLQNPAVRLALDSPTMQDAFERATRLLVAKKVVKKHIRVFILVGFDSDPLECWQRCEWVVKKGFVPVPMWYHSLDALQWNKVSVDQAALGWTDRERRRIMDWYYNRSGSNPLKRIDSTGAL